MTDEAIPELDQCGFVRVPTDEPPELWMTCESCGKSDHFWLTQTQIRCRCQAAYSHAVRPDGQQFPVADLTFVPFKQGPMDLADTEWDPGRLALVAVVAIAIIGALAAGVAWLVLG